MSDIVKILPYSADLNETIKKTELHTLFVMSENLAHRFEIEIQSGDKAADLTGCTVTGYFTNFKEKTMITVPGKAEASRAIVTLNKPCYTLHGQFVLIIQVKTGDVETAVFHGEGFMRTNTAEKIIFDDYVIYDVNTLLSQISSMKTATDRANTAAAKAEALTINASGLAGDSNKLGGQPPEHYAKQEDVNQLSQQMVNYRAAANLLDNSDWREKKNIVNKRGQDVYTKNDDTIDRWRLWNGTVNVTDLGYISTTGQIYQTIDIPTDKTYTFAVRTEDGIAIAAGIPANRASATLGNVTITLTTLDGYVEVVIQPAEGYDVASAVWAALYEGEYTTETLPPYAPKGYANELLACEVAENGNVFEDLRQQMANKCQMLSKTMTGTTSANGNFILNFNTWDKFVPVAAFVISHNDVIAMPERWNASNWGLHICSSTSDMAALASTEVTLKLFYIEVPQ